MDASGEQRAELPVEAPGEPTLRRALNGRQGAPADPCPICRPDWAPRPQSDRPGDGPQYSAGRPIFRQCRRAATSNRVALFRCGADTVALPRNRRNPCSPAAFHLVQGNGRAVQLGPTGRACGNHMLRPEGRVNPQQKWTVRCVRFGNDHRFGCPPVPLIRIDRIRDVISRELCPSGAPAVGQLNSPSAT